MNKLFIHPQKINADPLWLAFFRCSISALAFFNFLAIQRDFNALFSMNGYVSPDISSSLSKAVLPTIYSIQQSLQSMVPVSYEDVLLFFRIIYPISLLLLFLGLFTRVSALLSLVIQLIIINSIDFYSYGVDTFIAIALFYCMVFPVGKTVSLDNKLFKKKAPAIPYHKYLTLLRTHVCIIYFFSGFEKLLGFNWWNGESIWKVLHTYKHADIFNLDFLAGTPVFFLMGWVTIIIEMCYPLFMNIRATRKIWLAAILGLHLSIALLMGLYFFSAVMIALNLATYYVPFVKEKEGHPGGLDEEPAATTPYTQYQTGPALSPGTG